MESIRAIKGLVKQGDWLLKLDLKDAYLTVPIHQDHQRFLHFQWQGQTWQFRVLPFGLSSAPLTFTKLTKPIVSTLRRLGIRMSLYLDDMLLMADSVQEARAYLRTAIEILVALGFVINMEKSTYIPTISEAGVPGLLHQYSKHDAVSPTSEAPFHSDTGKTHSCPEEGNNSPSGPPAGNDGGSPPCSPTGPSPTYTSVVLIPPQWRWN